MVAHSAVPEESRAAAQVAHGGSAGDRFMSPSVLLARHRRRGLDVHCAGWAAETGAAGIDLDFRWIGGLGDRRRKAARGSDNRKRKDGGESGRPEIPKDELSSLPWAGFLEKCGIS